MHNTAGFTVVELITVIIAISILASMTMFGVFSWQNRASENQVKSSLLAAKSAMESARSFDAGRQYPASINYTPGPDVTLTGGATNGRYAFCIRGQSTRRTSVVYYITNKISEPTKTTCTYP